MSSGFFCSPCPRNSPFNILGTASINTALQLDLRLHIHPEGANARALAAAGRNICWRYLSTQKKELQTAEHLISSSSSCMTLKVGSAPEHNHTQERSSSPLNSQTFSSLSCDDVKTQHTIFCSSVWVWFFSPFPRTGNMG